MNVSATNGTVFIYRTATGGDDRDPNSYFPTDVQGALGPF
jgi:hypothetical protein